MAGKSRRRDADMQSMQFREFNVRAGTLDVESRSITAVVATESPVPMPDWQRMEMVPEVLLMAGAQYPSSRQVPLLDSHSRWSTDEQLGSARELATSGEQMTSRIVFSSTAESQFTKVREGHLTDVSVGYEVLKRTYIPAGTSMQLSGRQFDGPLNVVTAWRVREVSVTPIGADQQAKMRGFAGNPFESRMESFVMKAALRDLAVSRGMPADLDDEAAQDWIVANADKMSAKPEEKREAPKPEVKLFDPAEVEKRAAAAALDAIKRERERVAAIRSESDALCKLADLPESFARSLYDCDSVEVVRIKVAEEKARKRPDTDIPPAIRITGEGRERFVSDIKTALVMRAASANARDPKTVDQLVPVAERGKGYDTFRHATLLDMAREWVQMHGVQTRGLTREEIAICAMFGPEKAGIRSDAAYHTTGSFANLTLDAINKAMMVGYTEAPSTWQMCFRQATSVPDFKTINRIRLGAMPNLPVWPDNKDPETVSLADAKETYAVESRSATTSFSYRLIVNDDMDALSRAPAQFGQAARRTVNAVAWAQITSNPTMSDAVALFAAATGKRKRTNLTTGAGAPSVTTVQTLTNLMMQMRGENTPEDKESDDILSLSPAYIVGGSALSTTIQQLVNSAFDPSSSVNHQVFNPTRVLTPIIEPLLDASSTTAWYLFASPAQIDTVEVTFLQGQENPVVRSWMSEENLSLNYTVLQTYAAKAMNHRGMQKHAGA